MILSNEAKMTLNFYFIYLSLAWPDCLTLIWHFSLTEISDEKPQSQPKLPATC